MDFSTESGGESGGLPQHAVNPEVKPLLDLPVGPAEKPVGDIIVTVRESDLVDESGTGQALDMMFGVTGRVPFSTCLPNTLALLQILLPFCL